MFEYYNESVDGYDYGSIDTYYDEVINIFPQQSSDISKPQVIKPTTANVISTPEPSVTTGSPSTVLPSTVKQTFDVQPHGRLDGKYISAQPHCNVLDSSCSPPITNSFTNGYNNKKIEKFGMSPMYYTNSTSNLTDNSTMIILMFIILLFFIMYQKMKIENLKFMLRHVMHEKYNKQNTVST
jgi:hypothetical protein